MIPAELYRLRDQLRQDAVRRNIRTGPKLARRVSLVLVRTMVRVARAQLDIDHMGGRRHDVRHVRQLPKR